MTADWAIERDDDGGVVDYVCWLSLVMWLNGGRGSAETVRAHIQRAEAMWVAAARSLPSASTRRTGDTLAGTIDVQLHQPYATPQQANLAFGLYPPWRGAGPGHSRGAPRCPGPSRAHRRRAGAHPR